MEMHDLVPEALAGQILLAFLFGFFAGACVAYARLRRSARKEVQS